MSHHPEKGLRPGRGLHYNFYKLLKDTFLDKYNDLVLKLTTRVLTRFRVRTINRIQRLKDRTEKRRNKRKIPKEDEPKSEKNVRKRATTARGRRQTVDRIG